MSEDKPKIRVMVIDSPNLVRMYQKTIDGTEDMVCVGTSTYEVHVPEVLPDKMDVILLNNTRQSWEMILKIAEPSPESRFVFMRPWFKEELKDWIDAGRCIFLDPPHTPSRLMEAIRQVYRGQ